MISANSEKIAAQQGVLLAGCHFPGLPGVAGHPVLHAEKAVLETVIEFLRLIVPVDRTIVADLVRATRPTRA